MLNGVCCLRAPGQFDLVFEPLSLEQGKVIVRPAYLSICNADQRYYQGTRPPKILAEKLPLALIHEGIGRVAYDPSGIWRPGELAVMIPNLPRETNPYIHENYLPTSRFCSSSADGFLKEYVSMESSRLLSLPAGINPCVAAFTEMVSVGVHAVRRFVLKARPGKDVLGVWGDGNLGYIVSLLLKVYFPRSQVIVFGKNTHKLSGFTFADQTFLIQEIPDNLVVCHGFECVGGMGAANAINQIIDHIEPEGMISVLGVSEYPVALNTRMLLEKGLYLCGSSRSQREDFCRVLELYRQFPHLLSYLETIAGNEIPVRSVKDVREAFAADWGKLSGKTIMKWDM